MEKPKSLGRDSFKSSFGFIIACIGSAVGMGNIWLFPRRVSEFGAPFLIAYLVCVVVIGFTGVIGEMAFGRASKAGPMGAFETATQRRFGKKSPGGALSMIPVVGSFALAIGYSVVVGWIIKYLAGSFTGSIIAGTDFSFYENTFFNISSGHNVIWWHLIALAITFGIVIFGISKGIEKVNKVMMPLFFLLFIGIAIYVGFQNGAVEGYKHMFVLSDWSKMLDANMWKYALGQAFFSLSLAGSGTLVYGSYLGKDKNIPRSAMLVALFDTLAAFVAALAIIPAMSTIGVAANEAMYGGPGLLFVYLPQVFKGMPGGPVVMVVFFIAVLLAGITSLINLFESPIEALQTKFKMKRTMAVGIIALAGTVIAVLIEAIVSDWMDICSIYICPIGALLAAIMFFWIYGKDDAILEIDTGSKLKLGRYIVPFGKFVFCGLTIIVLILGSLTSGGIG